jgi:hypothetical protein
MTTSDDRGHRRSIGKVELAFAPDLFPSLAAAAAGFGVVAGPTGPLKPAGSRAAAPASAIGARSRSG